MGVGFFFALCVRVRLSAVPFRDDANQGCFGPPNLGAADRNP